LVYRLLSFRTVVLIGLGSLSCSCRCTGGPLPKRADRCARNSVERGPLECQDVQPRQMEAN